jgi:hypothetical protein
MIGSSEAEGCGGVGNGVGTADWVGGGREIFH